MRPDLPEVRKLVPVSGGDGDDVSARVQVLRHAAGISSVLVESDELRNLVVGVDDFDPDPRVVVQRVGRTVLPPTHTDTHTHTHTARTLCYCSQQARTGHCAVAQAPPFDEHRRPLAHSNLLIIMITISVDRHAHYR